LTSAKTMNLQTTGGNNGLSVCVATNAENSMGPWRRDLVFAFRRFCKSPGFVFAVIVSIGLGIGANATIFSIVRTFLLRPPAVGDPATLMSVFTTRHGDCCGNNLSWLLYNDLRDQTRSFSGVTAFYPLNAHLHRWLWRTGACLGRLGGVQLLRRYSDPHGPRSRLSSE
jgi:hypothetical protein